MAKKLIFYITSLIGIIILNIVVDRTISIFGVSPNIILITVIFVALVKGTVFGEMFGFLCGLAADTLSVGLFGANGFSFTLIGFMSGLMSRKLDISQPKAQVVFVFVLSMVYMMILFVIYSVFSDAEGIFSAKNLWFSPLLNAFCAPPVYWFFKKWMRLWFPRERLHLFSGGRY